MNFSLYSGFGGDVLSKVLRGQPDMTQEKPDTSLSKNREDVQPHDSDKGNIIPETHTVSQHKDNTLSTRTASTPTLVPGIGKDDVNITEPFRQQSQMLKVSKQNYTTIQEDIKQEIRNGKYKIEIAPSDLVDFGGQRSFDMTHQLFMRHKGTFVLMFNGRIDFSVPLDEYKQGETAEGKLVSDIWNLFLLLLLTSLEGSCELLQLLCVRFLSVMSIASKLKLQTSNLQLVPWKFQT